jgi:hypothetical protein
LLSWFQHTSYTDLEVLIARGVASEGWESCALLLEDPAQSPSRTVDGMNKFRKHGAED